MMYILNMMKFWFSCLGHSSWCPRPVVTIRTSADSPQWQPVCVWWVNIKQIMTFVWLNMQMYVLCEMILTKLARSIIITSTKYICIFTETKFVLLLLHQDNIWEILTWTSHMAGHVTSSAPIKSSAIHDQLNSDIVWQTIFISQISNFKDIQFYSQSSDSPYKVQNEVQNN